MLVQKENLNLYRYEADQNIKAIFILLKDMLH